MTTEAWVLHAAKDFRIGASMLEAHFGERVFPLRSTVVTLAFSIELYLKYFAIKASGQPSKGHDLSVLYAELPVTTREIIMRHYTHTVPINDVLAANRAVFVDWRYLYEKQDGAFSLDFRSLKLLSTALDAAAAELAAA